MAKKIIDWATLLAVLGAILVVWFQPSGDIRDNARAISGNALAIAELEIERTELQAAISANARAIAALDVKISELGRTIEREFFRDITSSREDIRELERRVTDLEGEEP